MVDKQELERLIRQGARANTVLNDPEFKSAYEEVRDELRDQFFAADPANAEELQRIAMEQQYLDAVVYRLLQRVQTAKGAEKQLSKKKTR